MQTATVMAIVFRFFSFTSSGCVLLRCFTGTGPILVGPRFMNSATEDISQGISGVGNDECKYGTKNKRLLWLQMAAAGVNMHCQIKLSCTDWNRNWLKIKTQLQQPESVNASVILPEFPYATSGIPFPRNGGRFCHMPTPMKYRTDGNMKRRVICTLSESAGTIE